MSIKPTSPEFSTPTVFINVTANGTNPIPEIGEMKQILKSGRDCNSLWYNTENMMLRPLYFFVIYSIVIVCVESGWTFKQGDRLLIINDFYSDQGFNILRDRCHSDKVKYLLYVKCDVPGIEIDLGYTIHGYPNLTEFDWLCTGGCRAHGAENVIISGRCYWGKN